MIPRACRSGRRHTKWGMVAQLELFSANAVASPQHREKCTKENAIGKRSYTRFRKDAWLWRSLFAAAGFCMDDEFDADDDTPDILPPVQRCISASEAPPLAAPRAPASVFDLAATPVRVRLAATSTPQDPPARRVIRGTGVVRSIALREQDTEEWAEKERQRRARQRPPRPPRQKFKMKGSRAWSAEQQ